MIGALVIPSTCGSSAATRRPARPCRSPSPPSPQLARRSMPRTIEPLRRHDDTRPGRSPTALLHLPGAAGLPAIRGRPTARPTPDRCGRRSHPTATRQRQTRHPRLMDGHTFGVNIFIGHGDAQRGNGYPTSQVPVGGNHQDQPHPGPRRGAAGHAISNFPNRFQARKPQVRALAAENRASTLENGHCAAFWGSISAHRSAAGNPVPHISAEPAFMQVYACQRIILFMGKRGPAPAPAKLKILAGTSPGSDIAGNPIRSRRAFEQVRADPAGLLDAEASASGSALCRCWRRWTSSRRKTCRFSRRTACAGSDRRHVGCHPCRGVHVVDPSGRAAAHPLVQIRATASGTCGHWLRISVCLRGPSRTWRRRRCPKTPTTRSPPVRDRPRPSRYQPCLVRHAGGVAGAVPGRRDRRRGAGDGCERRVHRGLVDGVRDARAGQGRRSRAVLLQWIAAELIAADGAEPPANSATGRNIEAAS